MKSTGTKILFSALVLTLAACSGGGGGGGGSSASMQAQFIDAPVKGLKVKVNGVASLTDAQGKFTCSEGQTTEFFLGELSLGYAACGKKIFVQDLSSPETGYAWSKAAALIQSFSIAGGGVLDMSVVDHSKLTTTSFNYSLPDIAGLLSGNTAAIEAGANLNAVTPEDAATKADADRVANLDLDSTFAGFLANFVSVKSGTYYIKGNLASGSKQYCFTNVYAQGLVEEHTASGGKKYYTNKIVKAAMYSLNMLNTSDISCKTVDDHPEYTQIPCLEVEDFNLPPITTIAAPLVASSFVNADGSVNNLNLRLAVKSTEEAVLSGSFINTYYPETKGGDATAVTCKYSLSEDEREVK